MTVTEDSSGTEGRELLAPSRALLADYAAPEGVADELVDASGAMRAVWAPFLDQLAKLTPEQVRARFARGDQYLRDAGVYYRQYSAAPQAERDWPLSHIPVLLEEAEWEQICAGLAQRAELLEHVVADLYGPGHLVREGHLPAQLVAGNPEWHRPLVGLVPASRHFLHFLAFEIGRSPDGSWLVLGDRAQAPSGAGFALENRMATARMFPEPFPRANARRLAGFFRSFRDAMAGLPGSGRRGTALLTPGPGNDAYFEHAYIARYLGLPLLEGEDLVVENGQLLMRTVSGPQPIGVLWRRLDAGFADPLELDERSQIGTPGLVDALRQGNVNLVNALGSGIVETRAFMAFLPKLAQHVLGAPLALPNLATWWCGQATERAYVQANAERMVLGHALSRDVPFDRGAGLRPPEGTDRAAWVDAQGSRLVGQEAVTLSTTPAWVEGRLCPRPMSIRIFAARTGEGWTFLPGGYARIGHSGDAGALSMQDGGSVADVWVMRDRPVREETLLEPARAPRASNAGLLPSRAADNLFWLGRYVARGENAIRLLRAYHLRLAEGSATEMPSIRRIEALLKSLSLEASLPLRQVLQPPLASARLCAGRIRDRFSPDGMAALAELKASVARLSEALPPGDETARILGPLLWQITGFNGLVHENMHRGPAWGFLSFGEALERADAAAAVLAAVAAHGAQPGLPDLALEFCDSRITHRQRYRGDPNQGTVMDLLALDPDSPRSIRFQLRAMRRIAERLPVTEGAARVSPVLQVLLPMETELAVTEPDDLEVTDLAAVRSGLAVISRRLSAAYLS